MPPREILPFFWKERVQIFQWAKKSVYSHAVRREIERAKSNVLNILYQTTRFITFDNYDMQPTPQQTYIKNL
jgi:hypothetical protein